MKNEGDYREKCILLSENEWTNKNTQNWNNSEKNPTDILSKGKKRWMQMCISYVRHITGVVI